MAIAGFEPIDFEAFHREELPRRAAAAGASAARAVAPLGSLGLRTRGGAAYTYALRDGLLAIEPGDAQAATVVELDAEDWQGLVHDYEAAAGLLYGNRVECRRGDAMNFVLWEPALRHLYTGRELFDPSAPLRDRRGDALDPSRAFHSGDDADEMSRFLRAAGFLLVRGVFAQAEVDAFLAEARELAGEARPGDKLSWWSRDTAGHEVLCRVTRAADKPRLATLPHDARVLGLVALAETELVHRHGEGNGVTVIFKNPGIREGLSDLPWHRDCGLGGHALMCPVLIVSTYLTPADADTGELRFLPGSHTRACGAYIDPAQAGAPRGVSFDARPGDVSVHYGDVMHAAPPPARVDLASYRVSAITGFGPPSARVHRGHSYNDALHRRSDGQIEHLGKVAAQAKR